MKFTSLPKCRLCTFKIHNKPILNLKNMPIAAQHFLKKKDTYKKDKSINLKILQCKNCGLVQLNIKPVNYYKSVITAASISGDAKKEKLRQLSSLKKKFNLRNKKIIEFGCGTGAVLDLIKSLKMKAFGLEFSLKSVNQGKRKKRNIIKGYLENMSSIKGAPFDGFVCYNFLEHIPKLNLFIKKIYKNLTENGVGIITVPNLDYLIKTKSFYEFVPDHLSYFTMKTIKSLFIKHNFKIIEIKLINNQNDIFLVIKKKKIKKKFKKEIFKKPIKIFNLKKDFDEVEKLITTLNKIKKLYRTKKEKIAIWGAGHRTLALLALSKFDEIQYIVDSAKFKQGLYSPINYTKIVSPDSLKKNPVNLLIVMLPGIYPNEVIQNVKRMNIRGLKLAKLSNNKIIYINK